jgi:hypothetical protein
MVAWGQFAQDIGLIESLMHVPVPQKMVRHAPQKELLEFQMAILVGVEYLQDINAGPHPLARDRTVAQTWGQDSLAHYSAISRTLGAPLITTHRVISYTYPSTLLRTGDALYRLTGADYSTG